MLNLKQIFLEAQKEKKLENIPHFRERCPFLMKIVFFKYFVFLAGRKCLLKLRTRYSWSALRNLSNPVEKTKKKFLLEVRITCTLQNVEMGYCTSKMDTYGHLGLDIWCILLCSLSLFVCFLSPTSLGKKFCNTCERVYCKKCFRTFCPT